MSLSESSDCLGAEPIHGDVCDLDEIERALLDSRDWRFRPGDYVLHMDRYPDCLVLVLSEVGDRPEDRPGGFKMPLFRVRDTKTGEVSVCESYSLSAPLSEMEVLARMAQ